MHREQQARPDLDAAYEADRQAVVRSRTELGAALFLAFVGLASAIEGLNHGDRSGVVMRFFFTQVAAAVIALLATRVSPLRSRPVIVAVALMAGLAAQMCAYNLVVTGPAELGGSLPQHLHLWAMSEAGAMKWLYSSA